MQWSVWLLAGPIAIIYFLRNIDSSEYLEPRNGFEQCNEAMNKSRHMNDTTQQANTPHLGENGEKLIQSLLLGPE